MDPAGQVTRRTAAVALTALITIFAGACGQSTRVAAPPPVPAPPPAAPEVLPSTLNEARTLRQSDPARYERALRALALSADPVTARRAEAMLAINLVEQKRFEDAIPALQTAAAADPVIAPYLELRLIDADVAAGRVADAIAVANAITDTAAASSASTIARLQLPALYAAAGDETNMTAALSRVAAIPIDELSEADFVSLAKKLETAGKNDAAAEIRMRIIREYPQGRFIESVYEALQATTPSPIDALSTEEATRIAASLARNDRYDQALDLLKRVSGRPDAPSSDLYRTVRLRALFNSRNYEQLLNETMPEDLDAPLLLVRSRAAWREDRPQEFLDGLNLLEAKFPNTPQAIEAKVLRSKYYTTDETDYARATENLSAAIAAGALGNDGENLWTLGFTYVLWGKYDEALSTFERYVRDYPDGDYKTNALFWSGKIHDRRGETAQRDAALRQVIAEYPFSYYAYRAREILKIIPSREDEVAGQAVFPDIAAELAAVTDPRLDAVRELVAVDLRRDATREMKSVAAANPNNNGVAFMLADIYSSGGEVFKAMNILQSRFRQFIRHGGVNIPQRLWEILYPLDYWETIRAEAQKRNIDPFLVASIIRQESGFEPTSVSNAGAVGLMQIMPGEAARIGEDAGLGPVTRAQLFDPLTNIAVGTAEYSQKLAAARGNDILAIAAYNAGQDNVGRWLAQTPVVGDGDPDIFVDSIPYAETRLYVKSVTRNRFEYRRVYEGITAVSEVSSAPDPPHR